VLSKQERTLGLRGVSSTALTMALLASGGGLSLGLLQGWPVWAFGMAAVVRFIQVKRAVVGVGRVGRRRSRDTRQRGRPTQAKQPTWYSGLDFGRRAS
jgi:hypothetical protein